VDERKSVGINPGRLVSQTDQRIFKKHENIALSHETIYKLIRKDKQNGGELYKHCRHKLKHRKRPVGSVKNIPNRTSIHQRPKEADGKRFGDFEMDTVIGQNHSEAILTITERKTNYIMIKNYRREGIPRSWQRRSLKYYCLSRINLKPSQPIMDRSLQHMS